MITQIDGTNTGLYEDFWNKLREISSLNINSIEEYFQNLATISGLENGRYTRLPLDEPYFKIDTNTRMIEIPKPFQQNGIGVKGDQIAEILYFRAPRYYDTTDLANDNIQILFEWKLKEKDYILPYYLKDIDSEPGYIIFGCPIDNVITADEGMVQLAVRFIEQKVESDIIKIEYSLSTKPILLMINSGLNFDITSSEINNSLEALIKSRFRNSEASAAQASEPIILSTNLDSDKGTYLVLLDLDSEGEPMLYVNAISPNGTTERMEYKLFKNGSPTDATGSWEYIATKDNKIDFRKTYYVKDSKNEDLYIKEDNPIIEQELYEKVYKFNLDKNGITVGTYKIQVINIVGYDSDGEGKEDQVYTKSTYTHKLTLPEPKSPIVSITNKNSLVFDENNNEFILSTKISNWEGNEKGAKLEYIWYKDNEEISGAKEETYKIQGVEDEKVSLTQEHKHVYNVQVKNTLHGAEALSELSNPCIVSYSPSDFVAVDFVTDGSQKAGSTINAVYSLANPLRSDSVIAKWYINGHEYNNSNENSLYFTIPTTGDYKGLKLTCKLYNIYNGAQIEAKQIPELIIAA